MMEKLRENRGIKHYWNYFIENFKISFKLVTEYKSNLYSSICLVFFWDLVFITVGLVMNNNFLYMIGWDFADYCLFLLISYLIYNITTTFQENKWLENLIPNGNLNNYLYIPGNRFFNYFLHIKFNTIIFNIGNVLIFLPIIIIFGNMTYKYIYLSSTIFVLLIILNTILYQFMNSVSFLILKFTTFFVSIYDYVAHAMQAYTPLFFDKSSYRNFLVFFQIFFIAKLIIPLFHGIIIEYFWFYIMSIISLISLFAIGTWVLWHYGLKKYEAFG